MMLETQTVSRMFGSSNDASLIHTLSGRLMSHEVDAQLLRFYDFSNQDKVKTSFCGLGGDCSMSNHTDTARYTLHIVADQIDSILTLIYNVFWNIAIMSKEFIYQHNVKSPFSEILP